MKKVLHWLDENLEASICMILMCVFATVLFIQVIMRYIFNNSLSWSEELARYIFIWLVFIGISFGAKEMKHLKIDAFLAVFPKKARPYVAVIAEVIVLVFSCIVVYAAFTTVAKYFSIKSASPALKCPMWFIHSAPIVGYGLTIIRQVQAFIYRLKVARNNGIEPEKPDEEEVII